MTRQGLWIGIVCLVSLGLGGCGQAGLKLTPVQGKVTYKGLPLAGATVRFVPAQGEFASAVTDADGKFSLTTGGRPGAAVGRYRVSVGKYGQPGIARGAKYEDLKKAKRYQGGKIAAPPKSEIPEKYGDPDHSGLAAEVTGNPAKDAFEFGLTD